MVDGYDKRVVAAIDDLFFMVKVKDAATAAGLGIEFAKSKDDAVERARRGCCLVVVDLNAPKFRPVELVEELKKTGTRVLAFLSHVNIELRAKAEEAGADRVLARSALAQNVNAIFREFAAEEASKAQPE
jgi:CheY-like chemotaxis protein